MKAITKIFLPENFYSCWWTNDGADYFEIVGTTGDKIMLNHVCSVDRHREVTMEVFAAEYWGVQR